VEINEGDIVWEWKQSSRRSRRRRRRRRRRIGKDKSHLRKLPLSTIILLLFENKRLNLKLQNSKLRGFGTSPLFSLFSKKVWKNNYDTRYKRTVSENHV
jgi:hypothetical protein